MEKYDFETDHRGEGKERLISTSSYGWRNMREKDQSKKCEKKNIFWGWEPKA